MPKPAMADPVPEPEFVMPCTSIPAGEELYIPASVVTTVLAEVDAQLDSDASLSTDIALGMARVAERLRESLCTVGITA